MSILMALMLTVGSWHADVRSLPPAVPPTLLLGDGDPLPAQGKERIVLRKDGGPGHGPDQSYAVREQGATDLEGFVGGKYVVIEGPLDVVLFTLVVVLVVVLIIAL